MTWKTVPLRSILAPAGNSRAGDQDLPVLSVTMRDGLIKQSDKFNKRVASDDISDYRVVYPNQLVVGFPIDEGVLGFQTLYPAAVVSPAYTIWQLKSPAEIHVPFLEGYLRSQQARKIYADRMRGAVARRRSLTREDFLAIEIPLPSLEEQIKIASILSQIDHIQEMRCDALQAANDLIVSSFLHMFGDPIKNPMRWPVVNFGTEMDSISYGTSEKSHEIRSDRARPILRIPNVTAGKIDWNDLKFSELTDAEWEKLKLLPGDLLFVRTNGNPSMVARTAVYSGPHDAAFASYLIRVRLRQDSRLRPGFVNAMLAIPSWRARLLTYARTAAGNYNINAQAIRGLELIAPDTELQKRFLTLLERHHGMTAKLQESARAMKSLREIVQQRAYHNLLDLSRIKSPLSVKVERENGNAPAVEPKDAKTISKIFLAPSKKIERELKTLDALIAKGEPIPWSYDYFRYRILGCRETPFSFGDLLKHAKNVFDEPPPYEVIRELISDLLGQNGEAPVLVQRFDYQVDNDTEEAFGRREIVFDLAK
ncbi:MULTISPECIES: restriction endonuclease subunit S [unclassified Burkholderia]|uniref:restriction endonuclease subunit S n=1 Tax=unclassified Burkholderia TaxID=2613784 RepID=UPI00141EC46B|nr:MULTISPECIES: restriction endonuclease subunit S [unclassified Burkholderia]NIE61262.1 type I restriction endonuclease [Burkholderia sp. Ap-955]NIF13431.1 type I restriction endonuclease [Burkholderia sp. Ax-1735]NIG06657.1 type I restriction endonuclease [Burkholderia sp. Tr-849]